MGTIFIHSLERKKYNNVNNGVNMAISNWTEPIHECQQGEVRREWCYLHQYYPFFGDLKQYAELLKYVFCQKYTSNIPQPAPEFDKYLEKHEIQFHPDDIRKGKPPSHDVIKNWSKGSNTAIDEKHTWNERRISKQNEVGRLAEQNAAATIAEQLPYIVDCVVNGLKETDEAVRNSKNMGNFTPHQAESATKSRAHVVESLQKLTGKDKNYNVKTDVNADISAEVKQQPSAEAKMEKLKELREQMDRMEYD